MITVGTIKKINNTPRKSYVLVSVNKNEQVICSMKNTDGLRVGEKVVVEGARIRSLVQNAILIKATKFSNSKQKEAK